MSARTILPALMVLGWGTLAAGASGSSTRASARVPANRQGKNYFVDFKNGSDAAARPNDRRRPFKTLAAAAKVIDKGDVVYLRGRRHVDDSFKPARSGTAERPITVRAYPNETPVFTGKSSIRGGGIFDLSGRSHYVLDGIRFADTTAHWSTRVIYLVKSSHITIRNCEFKNVSSSPIKAIDSSYLLIERCRFDTFGSPSKAGSGDQMFMAGVQHSIVRKCYFTRGGHAAITFYAEGPRGLRGNRANPKKLSRYNKIVNNVIEQHWGFGIGLGSNSEYNLVEGNVISYTGEKVNYPKPGISITGSHNTVRRNVIFNARYRGIYLGSYDFGGVLQYSRGNLVYNNTVYNVRTEGIGVWIKGAGDVANNVIANNVVLSTGSGIDGHGVSFDLYHVNEHWRNVKGRDAFANGNTFHHNLFAHGPNVKGSGMVRYITRENRHNKAAPLAFWQRTYPKVFYGNIDTDRPGLVNPQGEKFELRAGSVLIDKGVPIRDTNGDKGGWKDLTFIGKAPDIGAFEYDPKAKRLKRR